MNRGGARPDRENGDGLRFSCKSVGLSVEEESKEQSNMSKRASLLALSLIANLIVFARDYSGHRYYDDPDIGLPSGSEVGTGLIIAIIAIPIGYLILNMSNSKSGEDNTFGGCLGVIFIVGGLVGLLPLVAWLCAIGNIIIGIGIVLFVIIGVIGWLTSKKK